MSKRGYISRYMLIIKKLKTHPYSTFDEIRDYIDNHLEYLQMMDDTLVMGVSIRTFQRDVREIRNMFGIDIAYSRSPKGYYIAQSEFEHMNFQRMPELEIPGQSFDYPVDFKMKLPGAPDQFLMT